MTGWLQSIDVSLFRFLNASLDNPFFDRIMPVLSDSPWLAGALALAIILLVWKGGVRGRVCVLMFILAILLGNALVVNSIKNAAARMRPYETLTNIMLRAGKGGSYSMPSSHAANWFSFATIFFIYYRRSAFVMVPMALLVCLSRIYLGVHYPSDVLAGALLGAGYSIAVVWLLDSIWQFAGTRWFPLWKRQLPSLINPVAVPVEENNAKLRDAQWLRLGYVLAGVLLVVRLGFLASGKIELSEDEAYQWLWSKHPALSYYSKPPLIAYTQFVGTHLWGDNQFGVRFFSPIITAIMSILVLRFMARETSGRTAFFVLIALCACPLLALGAVVMTVDPLSVLFWMAALLTGWRAAKPDGTTGQWLWTGLWMGLGFLSKYTNLFQFVCWAVFFLLWPPARAHLRRRGPWLALLIVVLCMTPVVIWNSQRHWITVAHVASDGKLGEASNRNFTLEFLLTEAGVLNPFFFVAALWAGIAFWRNGGRRDPLQLYFFSMGAPLFLLFFGLSFHARVLANWIVPSVVPLFFLMAVYWRTRWKQSASWLKPCFALGTGLGIFAVVLAHDTQLITKLIHRRLPARRDVLRRVHGWKEMGQIVGAKRQSLAADGKAPFIICEHYGFTSQISFYLPEAKNRVTTDPFVFYLATPQPDNQFYFWPSYLDRKGENALFVREGEEPRLRSDWFARWWHHESDLYEPDDSGVHPLPPDLIKQFASIKDLGVKDVRVEGDIVRRVHFFECENLR